MRRALLPAFMHTPAEAACIVRPVMRTHSRQQKSARRALLICYLIMGMFRFWRCQGSGSWVGCTQVGVGCWGSSPEAATRVRTVRRTPNSAERRGSQTSLCRATSRSVLLTLWMRSTSLGGRQRNTSTRHSRGKSSSIFGVARCPGTQRIAALRIVCATRVLNVTPSLVAVYAA